MNTETINALLKENKDTIQIFQNKKRTALRFNNYQYNFKANGKSSTSFVCASQGCLAAISLSAKDGEIIHPLRVTHINNDHKCEPKEDDYFVIQKFLKNIGEKLTTDTTSLRSTHQLYEEARAAL